VSVFLPLSVMLPAAALEAEGFQVSLVDQRIDGDWKEQIAAVDGDCLFLGISAMTGPQLGWALRGAEIAKEADPEVPVVWGGTHPTILPAETLADDRVDAVVAGKGERAAVDVARKILRGGREAVTGAIHEGPSRRSPSGLTLRQPRLDYRRLRWSEYVTPVVDGTEGLAHVTSRGCPHRCSYCYNRVVNRSRWRGEPAEQVLDDLQRLRDLGCRGVLLFEDNFFADRRRAEAVAEGILERGLDLKIKSDCRADYVLRYDEAFLRLLRRAGFEVLFVGAESGSDRVLEMINKGVTVGGLVEANRSLARAGIRPHYSFMAGLPGESERDVYSTVRLMRRLKKENPAAMLSPVKGYVPYPGTRTFERAVEMGFRPPSSLEGWSRFDWNGCPRPWLSKRQARLVEKASYVTAGIDTQLVENSGIKRNPIYWRLYRFYARICRKRCERREFGPMPELPLLRLGRRLLDVA
jgi:radical SAM superfamily enzyme YgiQ (UPF0313 family)